MDSRISQMPPHKRGGQDVFDVVITGAGLGGLLSAVILAREGMKVCILEKNKQAGGCLQTFALHKTVFDSCVHYIGGLGEGHTLHRIFRYAGIMDKLNLSSLDPDGFDRICFGDEPYSYPQAVGFDNFKAQLLTCFPREKKAINEYISAVIHVGNHFPLYRLRTGDAGEKSAVSGWELTRTLMSFTRDVRLQHVLAGNNLLYAGEKDKTPFYLHALVLESYIHSAHKVLPGSSQIAKFLWQELHKAGGCIFRNTTVTKLVEEGGLIRYAETATRQKFYGKHFIANIHPDVMIRLLDSNRIRPAYRNRIAGLRQTVSAFMLNLVLSPGKVPARNYNLYWHASQDVWQASCYDPDNWPENYALYCTASAAHPGYAESLSVLTYMHYDEVRRWDSTSNHSGCRQERGQAYLQFKEERAETLLRKVYQRVPELKGNIIASSAATPLTYRDYTATPEGALYGIFKDVDRANETQIATRTKIPNLLLTGQNVNLHGVLGVSITALATCAELLGLEYLLSKIHR